MKSLLLGLGVVAGCLSPSYAQTFTFDADAEQVPPAIALAGGRIQVSWPDWLDGRQGRLERAPSLMGPWQSVSRSSPYPSDPSLTLQQFYQREFKAAMRDFQIVDAAHGRLQRSHARTWVQHREKANPMPT